MPDDTIIVPVKTVTGALHFTEIPRNGLAKDVIDTLLVIDGIREEILGKLEDLGWALQRIRVERKGRLWEEDELMALGDGSSSMLTSSGRCSISSRNHQARYTNCTAD